MNKNDPENPPQIQLTPVAFSPTQPDESIGPVGPPPAPPPFQYPVFWPILIILLTLMYTTTLDIIALNKRIEAANVENEPAVEALKKSGEQTEFVEALRTDLLKLSSSDPLAAKIYAEYFPATPTQKPDSPDDAAKTPDK